MPGSSACRTDANYFTSRDIGGVPQQSRFPGMPECHAEQSNGAKTMHSPKSSRISVVAECAIEPTARIDPSDDRLTVYCNKTRLC